MRACIEAIEPNEDEEGLAEPAEVKEFMQEMGEPNSRYRFSSPLSHMLMLSAGQVCNPQPFRKICGQITLSGVLDTDVMKQV